MSCVYLNGEFLNEDQASIPITDRGFLFGDGVFTTIKVEEGNIQYLEQHLKRIAHHCQALNIIPPEIDENDLCTLIQRNNSQTGLWRMKIVVTGGSGLELALPKRPHGTVLITMKRIIGVPHSPATVVVYPHPIVLPHSSIKSLSYLQRLQVKQYAIDRGADDAVVLSPEGYILETAFSNIFWVEGNDFYTPKSTHPLMRGITLNNHIEVFKQKGGNVYEGNFTLADLSSDKNAFLCNSIEEKKAFRVQV